MKPVAFLLLCLAPLLLPRVATGADDHDHDHDEHGGEAHGPEAGAAEGSPAGTGESDHADLVVMEAATLEEFGVELSTAGPGTIERHVTLPGEVRANADRLAHIVPRFSGIVTEVRANVGDRVVPGQTLAVVESDESLAPFEVKTLIPGTVVEKHITLGEAVTRERDVFLIADLSTVWAELTVYQRDLARVQEGQAVQVFVGHEPVSSPGRVGYITPIVDEGTRTATARIVLPNPDGRWRPGMFIRGRVRIGQDAVPVAVPPSALQTYEGSTVVFVQTARGFEPRPVRIGRTGEEAVEIETGLSAGDRYVSRGGFTLKSELGRESLGHAGHAH